MNKRIQKLKTYPNVFPEKIKSQHFMQALHSLDYQIIILKKKVTVFPDLEKGIRIKLTRTGNDKSFCPPVLSGVWKQGKYMTQSKAEKSDRAHFSSFMHLLKSSTILSSENSKWKRKGQKSLSRLTVQVKMITKR